VSLPILGVDPGLVLTVVAQIDEGPILVESYGFAAKREGPLEVRVDDLVRRVIDFVGSLKADEVAIERPVGGRGKKKNIHTAITQGIVAGELRRALVHEGLNVLWVWPTRVRQTFKLRNNAPKVEVQKAARLFLGLVGAKVETGENAEEAVIDAAAIALTGQGVIQEAGTIEAAMALIEREGRG